MRIRVEDWAVVDDPSDPVQTGIATAYVHRAGRTGPLVAVRTAIIALAASPRITVFDRSKKIAEIPRGRVPDVLLLLSVNTAGDVKIARPTTWGWIDTVADLDNELYAQLSWFADRSDYPTAPPAPSLFSACGQGNLFERPLDARGLLAPADLADALAGHIQRLPGRFRDPADLGASGLDRRALSAVRALGFSLLAGSVLPDVTTDTRDDARANRAVSQRSLDPRLADLAGGLAEHALALA